MDRVWERALGGPPIRQVKKWRGEGEGCRKSFLSADEKRGERGTGRTRKAQGIHIHQPSSEASCSRRFLDVLVNAEFLFRAPFGVRAES